MKISIIIPVYNIDKFLSRCLDSVLAQTYANWEAILIDDGSSDKSGDICDIYLARDSRIKVVHKKNEGVVSARKEGIKLSEGEFIYFLDGDDYISPDALSLLVSKQKENDTDIVLGNFKTIKEDSICGDGIDFFFPHFCDSYSMLLFRIKTSVWAIWNILFRRTIVKETLSLNEELSIGEDLVMFLKIPMFTNRIDTISEITYFYLVRDSSATVMTHSNSRLNAQRKIPMVIEIDKMIDVYKKSDMPSPIITQLEFMVVNVLCREIIPSKDVFESNKGLLLTLYKKYFSHNAKIRVRVFKRSPRRYFRFWAIRKRFK